MVDLERIRLAEQIKSASDVKLPELVWWNYSHCPEHLEEIPGIAIRRQACSKCGIPSFRRHQRIGIPWLYTRKKALLADTVGSGKTIHVLALAALLKQKGHLSRNARMLIVVKPAAVGQWELNIQKLVPDIPSITLQGTPSQRRAMYRKNWDIGLISYMTLMRDTKTVADVPINSMMIDDVDPVRSHSNATYRCLKTLTSIPQWVAILHGTPLQKRLMDLHAELSLIGGEEVLGSRTAFERRYVRKVWTERWITTSQGRHEKLRKQEVVGYKNVDKFKEIIQPYVLRRTDKDIDDVDLPDIQANPVYLDLYPRQRDRYEELRAGVLRILKEEGEDVSSISAMSKIHAGTKICAGLATIDEEDGPEASVKLDWVEDELTGDLEGEKVVIFAYHIATIQALQRRLDRLGVSHITIWGADKMSAKDKKEDRKRKQAMFMDPDGPRVLIGNTAIEQSLNLQAAQHIICLDTILNPARMEQIVGRIRRDGSPFRSVHVHYLWTVDTQESGYEALLSEEQAIIDHVWDEESSLFERISPVRLLELIAG